MSLDPTRVREISDQAAALCTSMVDLYAKIHRFVELNADAAISFTPATKTATIANATDIWTSTAHGMTVDQKVRLTNSGGALPTGFAINTDYWVIAANLAANTFQLSATKGGATVNATTDGTGTHTVNPVPDYIEETAGSPNMSGRTFDRVQVSNAIGSLTKIRNLLNNIAVSQGDELGNLNQLAKAQGNG